MKRIKKESFRGVGVESQFNPDFHPKSFLELSRQGKNLTQIAARWDVTRNTIYEWGKEHPYFGDSIKKGQMLCEAWYSELGQAGMIGQAVFGGKTVKLDVGLYVWMTKNICKWTDKVDTTVKDTSPQDKKGVTIQFTQKAVKAMLGKIKEKV